MKIFRISRWLFLLIALFAFALHLFGRKGRSIKTSFFVYHPHSYGIATLMRVGFRFRGWQLLLHHFRPHQETEFHDHPWEFWTFVLWGGYRDESWHKVKMPKLKSSFLPGGEIVDTMMIDDLRMGSFRHRLARHAHRTKTTKHSWTIVLTKPKERDWCKGTPENWVCEGEVTDFDATRGMVKIDD